MFPFAPIRSLERSLIGPLGCNCQGWSEWGSFWGEVINPSFWDLQATSQWYGDPCKWIHKWLITDFSSQAPNFKFEVLLLYIMYAFACPSAPRPLLPTYHRQKCFPRLRLWSAGSDRTQTLLSMRQDSAPPHGCRQDTHIPSIVFITLQLPNTVLPFTDPRHWMGELFKCFPFKSNACSVFTPKTLLLNPQSEVDSRRISEGKKYL